ISIWSVTDIDECNENVKNNCSHLCINSPGSYYCKCPNGFQMSQDNKTCKCPKGFQESNNRTMCLDCGMLLHTENSTSADFRYVNQSQLPERFPWGTSVKTFFQIDLSETYRFKITAIATQGGANLNNWVKRYGLRFSVGAKPVHYREYGIQKIIKGKEDARSVVRYQFKEPFVTKTLQIFPDVDISQPVDLRTEVYGCRPTLDCILVGSMFWGLWSQRDRSNNYYKAFIYGINDTQIEFILEYNNGFKQVYKRTDPVLIIDKKPEKREISVNASVIAVHDPKMKEWYRTGTVINTAASEMGEFLASVRFDNGDLRLVPIRQLRLVKRPRFCQVKHVIQGL
ncbi:unnamed protein product, partial [Porites lobata]